MDSSGSRRRYDDRRYERRDWSPRSRDRRDEDSSRRKDAEDDRRRDNEDSSRSRDRDRGRDRERHDSRNEGAVPDLYAVCKARVHSIKPFGIFVRLDGFRCQGLVHISQISNHEVTQRNDPDEVKVQALSAIYDQAEELWVKIISIKQEEDGGGRGGTKIGCSIKYVSQSDGRDLDPNNLQLQSQESRPSRSTHLKANKDAIYDVVCPRCGGRGHLKNECYSTGDKVYELLAEEEEGVETKDAAAEAAARRTAPPEDEALRVVDKKRPGEAPRVVGKKRRAEGLPDSVSTVEEAKALIARLKAEKKEKRRGRKHSKHKRRRRESSTYSGSSSSS